MAKLSVSLLVNLHLSTCKAVGDCRSTQDQAPTECFIWEAARVEAQLDAGLAWLLGVRGQLTIGLAHGTEAPCGRRIEAESPTDGVD